MVSLASSPQGYWGCNIKLLMSQMNFRIVQHSRPLSLPTYQQIKDLGFF